MYRASRSKFRLLMRSLTACIGRGAAFMDYSSGGTRQGEQSGLLARQQACEIDDHDKPTLAANDAGDIAGAPADPDIGSRLYLVLPERRDFENPVGDQAEAKHTVFQGDIHDQHPGMGCRYGLGKAKLQPEI